MSPGNATSVANETAPAPAPAPALWFTLAGAATSALGLSASRLLLRRRLEAAHPVFAILLQDLTALSASAGAGAAVCAAGLLSGDAGMERSALDFVYQVIFKGANLFNQISWLVITCLR